MESDVTFSIEELAQVRNNLDKIFEELGLDAYVYEVEPHEGLWQLTIECATEDGWERVQFGAKEEYFLRGVDDTIIHDTLIDGLKGALAGCRLKK